MGRMEELASIVGKNLSSLRKREHLTQLELADKIGYSDKCISKWELGKALPSVDILKDFADFYGVSVDFLLEEASATRKEAMVSNKGSKNRSNKIIISLMAVCFIFFTAGAIEANAYISTGGHPADPNIWIVFVWAVPITLFIESILNFFFWGRNNSFWVLVSLFVWMTILAFSIHYHVYFSQEIWYIFLVAIPVQITIVLAARLK